MNKAEFIEKWLPSPLKNGGMFQSDISALIEQEKREAAIEFGVKVLQPYTTDPPEIIALRMRELYDEYLKQQ